MQKRLNYTLRESAIGGDTYDDAENPVYHKLHLPRDLSFTNRQNIEMTTRKGVPHIFGGTLTATLSAIDKGSGNPDSAGSIDGDDISRGMITIRILAPMSNWVMRNGAVKTHAAREKMFEKALVDDASRGAYAKTIRYCLESQTESYLSPVHSTSRTAFNGGAWDHTQLVWEPDTDGAYLKLSGGHNTEETNTTFSNLCMPQLYLASRGVVEDDSNVEDADTLKHSVLNKLFQPDTSEANDEVTVLSRDEQDNPPYDTSDLNLSDFNQLVEVGRLQFNPSVGSTASCYIEVPFGMCLLQTQILDHIDNDADLSLDMSFNLMKVGEM